MGKTDVTSIEVVRGCLLLIQQRTCVLVKSCCESLDIPRYTEYISLMMDQIGLLQIISNDPLLVFRIDWS